MGDLVVLPGLVDTHVHINEPGRTEWEGFDTATRAAAAGGITTLVDMPLNSSPGDDDGRGPRAEARGRRGASSGSTAASTAASFPATREQVEPLVAAGVLGFKAFLCHSGIDEFPNATEADLRAVMPVLARAGLPLLVHAELVGPRVGAAPADGRRAPELRAPISRRGRARGSTTRSGS